MSQTLELGVRDNIFLWQYISQNVPYKPLCPGDVSSKASQALVPKPLTKRGSQPSQSGFEANQKLSPGLNMLHVSSWLSRVCFEPQWSYCAGDDRGGGDPRFAQCMVLILWFADISVASISQAPTTPLQLFVQRTFSALLKWLSVLAATPRDDEEFPRDWGIPVGLHRLQHSTGALYARLSI